MNLKKLAPLTVAAMMSLVAMGTTACGDDSSSPTTSNTDGGLDNPGAELPIDTTCCHANPDVDPNSSSSVPGVPGEEITSSSDIGEGQPTAPGAECNPVPFTFPMDQFVDVGDIYKNIQCNEKVVFILRHAERQSFTGSASTLTEDGFQAAIDAGKKLIGPEPFKYIYSGMTRTKQTAMGVAAGRGEITYTAEMGFDEEDVERLFVTSPEFVADTIPELRDGWFLKDKDLRDVYIKQDTITNVNMMYSAWVYDGKYADVFYDLEARSLELIGLMVKDYASMPKYTMVASHDQVLMPLTAWATNKQIDLKLHEITSRKWLDYLAGVAIIINDKDEVRYVAARGMDE